MARAAKFGYGNNGRTGWRVLKLQEVRDVLGGVQRAGVEAAGEAKAEAGDKAIGGVAQGERNPAREGGKLRPGRGKLIEAGKHGSAARKQARRRGDLRSRHEDEDGFGRRGQGAVG